MSGVLEGQVAVVTGGGRGLGRVYAQTLASAGAAVAVVARSTDEAAETAGWIQKAGATARSFPVDVTDAAAVRAAIVEIEQWLGPISLLVNNAGPSAP